MASFQWQSFQRKAIGGIRCSVSPLPSCFQLGDGTLWEVGILAAEQGELSNMEVRKAGQEGVIVTLQVMNQFICPYYVSRNQEKQNGGTLVIAQVTKMNKLETFSFFHAKLLISKSKQAFAFTVCHALQQDFCTIILFFPQISTFILFFLTSKDTILTMLKNAFS